MGATGASSEWYDHYEKDNRNPEEPVSEPSVFPLPKEGVSRSDWFNSYPYHKYKNINRQDSLPPSFLESALSPLAAVKDKVTEFGGGVVNGALRLVGAETLRERGKRVGGPDPITDFSLDLSYGLPNLGYIYNGLHFRGPKLGKGKAKVAKDRDTQQGLPDAPYNQGQGNYKAPSQAPAPGQYQAPQQDQYQALPQKDQYQAPPQQDQYQAPPQQDQYQAPPQQDQYQAPPQNQYNPPPQAGYNGHPPVETNEIPVHEKIRKSIRKQVDPLFLPMVDTIKSVFGTAPDVNVHVKYQEPKLVTNVKNSIPQFPQTLRRQQGFPFLNPIDGLREIGRGVVGGFNRLTGLHLPARSKVSDVFTWLAPKQPQALATGRPKDPAQGYQEPPQGYQEPPQAYQDPAQGYLDPRQGNQNPTQGYQDPAQGYANPAQAYPDPAQGYQNPQQGYQEPPQGYQDPSLGYADPSQNLADPTSNYAQGPEQGAYGDPAQDLAQNQYDPSQGPLDPALDPYQQYPYVPRKNQFAASNQVFAYQEPDNSIDTPLHEQIRQRIRSHLDPLVNPVVDTVKSFLSPLGSKANQVAIDQPILYPEFSQYAPESQPSAPESLPYAPEPSQYPQEPTQNYPEIVPEPQQLVHNLPPSQAGHLDLRIPNEPKIAIRTPEANLIPDIEGTIETLYREDITQQHIHNKTARRRIEDDNDAIEVNRNIALRREDLDDNFTHLALVTDVESEADVESNLDAEQLEEFLINKLENSLEFGDKFKGSPEPENEPSTGQEQGTDKSEKNP